jgi:transcription elongation GreA/GreB family factor
MNKRELIRKIVGQLTAELGVYFRAAQNSRAEATDEQNKAESKYDTRGLEAAYLARGQSKQAAELEAAIAEYQKLEPRAFAADDAVDLGALVELQTSDETVWYFIGPRAGGTEVTLDRREILVITPQSPLGAQLLGGQPGGRLQLELAGRKQSARILSIC